MSGIVFRAFVIGMLVVMYYKTFGQFLLQRTLVSYVGQFWAGVMIIVAILYAVLLSEPGAKCKK